MTTTEAATRAAKHQYILKGPTPQTWSARMPAYARTVLCSDQERRERLEREGGEAVGQEYPRPVCRDEGRDKGYKEKDIGVRKEPK